MKITTNQKSVRKAIIKNMERTLENLFTDEVKNFLASLPITIKKKYNKKELETIYDNIDYDMKICQ